MLGCSKHGHQALMSRGEKKRSIVFQPWKNPLVDRVVGRLHGGERGGAEDGLRAACEAQQGQLGRQVFLHLEVESCMTLLE